MSWRRKSWNGEIYNYQHYFKETNKDLNPKESDTVKRLKTSQLMQRKGNHNENTEIYVNGKSQ
jgi:uncharacterized protein YjlB